MANSGQMPTERMAAADELTSGPRKSSVASRIALDPGRSRTLISIVGVIYALSTSVSLAVFLAGPGLQASFGPIDDHVPLGWMGEDRSLSLAEAWQILTQGTEISAWPETARFRPVYVGVQLIQSVLLGAEPSYWYLSVLAFLSITLLLGALSSALAVDWVLSNSSPRLRIPVFAASFLFSGIALAGLGAWEGIVTRLGPSELHGAMFLMIAVFGLVKLVSTRNRLWWILLWVGSSCSILSKESFVLLPLVAAGMGMYLFMEDRRRLDLVLGLSALTPLLLLAPVFVGNEQDIYGQAGGLDRIREGGWALFTVFELYWLPSTALILAAYAWWWLCLGRQARVTALFVGFLVGWSILFLWADVVIYTGQYRMLRYWMVFELAKVIQVAGAILLSLACVVSGARARSIVSVVALTASLLLLFRLDVNGLRQMVETRNEAHVNQIATQQYEGDLDEAVSRMKTSGNTQFVLVIPAMVEVEPSYAISGEIERRMGEDIQIFWQPDLSSEGAQTAIGKEIVAVSKDGIPERRIIPTSTLLESRPVLCGFINVDPYPLRVCTSRNSLRIHARGM